MIQVLRNLNIKVHNIKKFSQSFRKYNLIGMNIYELKFEYEIFHLFILRDKILAIRPLYQKNNKVFVNSQFKYCIEI
jgi:hypothetical protein